MPDMTPEEIALYGADDPTLVNAADPKAAEGSLVGTLIEKKDVDPAAKAAEEAAAETPAAETPEETTETTEEAPAASQEQDPRLEVARLEGELKALKELYASRPVAPAVPEVPATPPELSAIDKLVAIPHEEALKKFVGLLEAGKHLEAQEFMTEWKSAQLVAPAIRALQEKQAVVERAARSQEEKSVLAQVEALNAATKGDYKKYEKEMAALITADAASRRLGNPPLFKDLTEIYNICRAKAGVAPIAAASAVATGAKKALAKGPGSGASGGTATAVGGSKKPLTPEEKALEEFWGLSGTSL